MLRRVVELGVNLIDTADSYGPFVADHLIREALHPYPEGLVIATKVGFTRQGPGRWVPVGRPEYLRQQVELNLRHLGVERIDLLQLHRIDPKVPLEDQIGELAALQGEGKIRHIGLSEVPVDAHRGRTEDRPDRLGAEPLQPRRPRRERRPGPLRAREHRVHPVVPAGDRRAGRGGQPASPRSPRRRACPRASSRWRGCCTARR